MDITSLYTVIPNSEGLQALNTFSINALSNNQARKRSSAFDLPSCLSNCQSRMYADDTHLTYAGFCADNIQTCLNDDLVNVSNWLIANKLTLNMTKTEFMLIGSRQRLCTLKVPPRPSINGSPIEHVTTAKSLGVLIDDNLTWRSHIDKLTKKIASGIGAIKRIRHLVPYGTLHSIYQALVQPHFNYCNIVWETEE